MALEYLHGKMLAHRYMKPANILVDNRHYRNLSGAAIEMAWLECPLVCKLADFGESRSREIHTRTAFSSQTSNVQRGTPVYMAPEQLVDEILLTVVTFEDLKRVDIWAFGMTF